MTLPHSITTSHEHHCIRDLHTAAPEARALAYLPDVVKQVVVRNLIGLLKTYGFVPNGSRSYYLNRRCARPCR